jgi:hypothetical protein
VGQQCKKGKGLVIFTCSVPTSQDAQALGYPPKKQGAREIFGGYLNIFYFYLENLLNIIADLYGMRHFGPITYIINVTW